MHGNEGGGHSCLQEKVAVALSRTLHPEIGSAEVIQLQQAVASQNLAAAQRQSVKYMRNQRDARRLESIVSDEGHSGLGGRPLSSAVAAVEAAARRGPAAALPSRVAAKAMIATSTSASCSTMESTPRSRPVLF